MSCPNTGCILPDYWIAKTPVTNTQYKQFIDITGHTPPKHWTDGQLPKGKENHPITNVGWQDAVAFCQWANVRLLTEMEWEKAARGPSIDSKCVRIYPWGNEAPDKTHCNFEWNENVTTPVDKYPKGASFYGCLDMAGNVWEWTSTKWLHNYKNYVNKVDYSLGGGGKRVMRGGSFGSFGGGVRCAARYRSDFANNFIGFRVGWSPSS